MKQALSKYPYSPGSMALMEQLKHRILVLDGAMGTMIQRYGLDEHDFHSGCHCGCEKGKALKGCNDILSITRPDIIEDIHRQYLEAGADIVTTNTFNANAISLADYDMQSKVREINFTAARLTRRVADEYSARCTLYRLPIYGFAESLNASVAAGIVIYELARAMRN